MSRTPRRRPLPAFSTDSLSSDDSHYLSHHSHAHPTAPLLPPRSHTMTPDHALPPTTHRLAPRDRTLLMRSTRKLGQLLGTTPHVLELTPSSSPFPEPKLTRRSTLPHVQQALLAPSNPPRLRRPSSASMSSTTTSSTTTTSTPASPAPPPSPAADAAAAAARRQKMDKLKRTLGENVPAELVFRNHENASAGASVGLAARNALHAAKPQEHDPPRFSLWKKAAQGVPRKRSRTEVQAGRQPARSDDRPRTPPPRASSQAGEYSKQLWASRRASTPPAPLTLTHVPASRSNTSAAQQAINVRRANKMAQVFGTPPPHALYQITNTEGSDESLHNTKDLAKLAYMLDHDRDSLYDLLSTIRSPSPVDWPYEHRNSNPPPSPPPSPPMSPTFNARRRRAAKLARFFGVDYPRLYERMLTWDGEDADGSGGEETETPTPPQSPPPRARLNPVRPGLPLHAASAPTFTAKEVPRASTDTPRPSTSSGNSSSTAREHRRTGSLGLLAPDFKPAMSPTSTPNLNSTSQHRAHVRRSFTPPPRGSTPKPPPSPPPFFAFFPRDGEDEETEGNEDKHDGIGELAGDNAGGHTRTGSTGKVQTSATVHVQTGKSAGLKRVVSVSRDGRPKDDMQGVMSRLRELPGGR